MGDNTSIEWTDATWNPVSGCSKVSQGCKNCYAERLFPRPYPGRKFTDVRTHEDRLQQPLRWVKGRRIFVNSMSDLFHEDVSFEFIAKVFAVMACTTRHTYQVLTKRPERMAEFFAWLRDEHDEEVSGTDPGEMFWPRQIQPNEVWQPWKPLRGNHGGYDNCGPLWPLQNVWLGISAEDQSSFDERAQWIAGRHLADWNLFLSVEPLLGSIDIRPLLPNTLWSGSPTWRGGELKWVIAGGESGPNARPMHPDWARSLRDQCTAAKVPFFFKQWGEWEIASTANGHSGSVMPETGERYTWIGKNGKTFNPSAPNDQDCWSMAKVGKKKSGRVLDGTTWDQVPTVSS